MQYAESSVQGICSNIYCKRGVDGKRGVVAIRNIRELSYDSQACKQMMERYSKRYKGSMTGPADRQVIDDKMNTL